jgi:hypothetical protein
MQEVRHVSLCLWQGSQPTVVAYIWRFLPSYWFWMLLGRFLHLLASSLPFHLPLHSLFTPASHAVAPACREVGIDGHFILDVPATPERLRMLCADPIAATYADPHFRAKISC